MQLDGRSCTVGRFRRGERYKTRGLLSAGLWPPPWAPAERVALVRSKQRRFSTKVEVSTVATASTLVMEMGGFIEDAEAHRDCVILRDGAQQKSVHIELGAIKTNAPCRDWGHIIDVLYFDIMKNGIVAKKVNRRGRKQGRRIFLGVANGGGFELNFSPAALAPGPCFLSYRHLAQRGGVTFSMAQTPKFWVAHLTGAAASEQVTKHRCGGGGDDSCSALRSDAVATRTAHLIFSSTMGSTATCAGNEVGFERRIALELPSAIHARGLRECLLALRGPSDGSSHKAMTSR